MTTHRRPRGIVSETIRLHFIGRMPGVLGAPHRPLDKENGLAKRCRIVAWQGAPRNRTRAKENHAVLAFLLLKEHGEFIGYQKSVF